MVKQFYTVRAQLGCVGFLAVANHFLVYSWCRGMYVRRSSVFIVSFLLRGVDGLWSCGQLPVNTVGERH
jgi:uncharacterized protein (DUF486 family)